MKQRVISGVIVGIVGIVTMVVGGYLFLALAMFIAAWGSYEFCKNRNRKFNLIEYGMMLAFVLLLHFFNEYALTEILFLLVSLYTLSIFDTEVPFDEAAVTFMQSILLGFGVHFMIVIENTNKFLLGYIFLLVCLTDVFALFTGMKFGKHKLNERISPKKTIEGAIGGWFIGFLTSFLYAFLFRFFDQGAFFFLLSSLILPVISQIGDLAFSLMKRHYQVKDFSQLIPGHGGLLDRLDSMLFTTVIYGALILTIL